MPQKNIMNAIMQRKKSQEQRSWLTQFSLLSLLIGLLWMTLYNPVQANVGIQISIGWDHTCALDDSDVVCWGLNNYGQTTVPDLNHPTQIAAGEDHTCTLDDSGAVCWGRDLYDQTTVPARLLFDRSPDIFTFGLKSNIALNSSIRSNSITVSGINTAAVINVQNGDYRINGGHWISTDSTVNNGDVVEVRHTSATDFNQTQTSTLTIGGISADFVSVTLAEADNPQDPIISTERGIIDGRVYDGCNQRPLSRVDVHFNDLQGGRATQQADRDGRYSLQLNSGLYEVEVGSNYVGYLSDHRDIQLHAGETRIGDFYLLPDGGCAEVQPAETWQAMIIAGSGSHLPSGLNPIWNSTLALTDRAYNALLQQGFAKDDIRYFTADGSPRDPDQDGQSDVAGTADAQTLVEHIDSWAGGVEQFIFYYVGHGGVQSLQLQRDLSINPEQLKIGMDLIQSRLITDQRGEPGKLSVILDACKSGSFIAPLAKPNRYVVTSTAADLDAIIANVDGSNSFSYHFWGQIGFRDGWLGTAYQQARQAMSSERVEAGRTQKAQLDTDGSGSATENDYRVLGSYCYGDCNTHASVNIVIESVAPTRQLGGQLSSVLRVRASKPIVRGWVTIQRPDYPFPTDGTAISSILRMDLDCVDNSCQGTYNNFNLNDNYQVSFFVEDYDGNTAIPYTLELEQQGISDSSTKKRADAVFEASTGVLMIKDVTIDEQHYYVELIKESDGLFSVGPLYLLYESVISAPAFFDGLRVVIPSVYFEGSYYSVKLLKQGNRFSLESAVTVPGPG